LPLEDDSEDTGRFVSLSCGRELRNTLVDPDEAEVEAELDFVIALSSSCEGLLRRRVDALREIVVPLVFGFVISSPIGLERELEADGLDACCLRVMICLVVADAKFEEEPAPIFPAGDGSALPLLRDKESDVGEAGLLLEVLRGDIRSLAGGVGGVGTKAGRFLGETCDSVNGPSLSMLLIVSGTSLGVIFGATWDLLAESKELCVTKDGTELYTLSQTSSAYISSSVVSFTSMCKKRTRRSW
jgi:hypothetical protein